MLGRKIMHLLDGVNAVFQEEENVNVFIFTNENIYLF